MAFSINLHVTKDVNIEELHQFLVAQLVSVCVEPSDDGYYFYMMELSTRGVYFFETPNGYEITLQTLASTGDKELVVALVKYFKLLRPNTQYFVNQEPWDNKNPAELQFPSFVCQAQALANLLEGTDDVFTFLGPIDDFYIGPWLLQNIHVNTPAWEERLLAVLLQGQYQLPYYDRVAYAEVTLEKNNIIRFVSPLVDYIFKKCDYLYFVVSPDAVGLENMMVIAYDTFLNYLPEFYTRIDDYTVIAPALDAAAYIKLVNLLAPFDCSSDLYG